MTGGGPDLAHLWGTAFVSFAAFPAIVAVERGGLKVVFEFAKPPGNAQSCSVTAVFSNSGATPFTDLVFQAAVPKVRNWGVGVPHRVGGNFRESRRGSECKYGCYFLFFFRTWLMFLLC